MNTTFHSPDDSLTSVLLSVVVVWTLVWLVVLGTLLARKDLDPITKLTWVLVVILVPFFGVVFYCLLGPKRRPSSGRSAEHAASEPVGCVSCGAEIPAGVATCPKCGWSYESKSARPARAPHRERSCSAMVEVIYAYFANPTAAQVDKYLRALQGRGLVISHLGKSDPPPGFGGSIEEAISLVCVSTTQSNWTFGQDAARRLHFGIQIHHERRYP